MLHPSHGHGDGSYLAILTVFWLKMKHLNPKLKYFCKKMGQKGQKTMPEVADGHHGGLGRVQEGENGLDAGETF